MNNLVYIHKTNWIWKTLLQSGVIINATVPTASPHQSVFQCLKSDPTRLQAINVTTLHKQILFGGTLFVKCNDHISKYITFDWVCSGGSNNKNSLILVLWCRILNHMRAALLYNGLQALILLNSETHERSAETQIKISIIISNRTAVLSL